jgi:NAD(P)-dependent dehydrogenase (short-subunit alcohol dehydrogenase family)
MSAHSGLLNGKSVVITGGGQGLGAQYALLAAAEGAAVVVNDVDEDVAGVTAAAIRTAGGTAVGYGADVSDWHAAGRLIDFCVNEFGAIDGLVNNAGILVVGAPAEMDPARIRRLMDVNVMGTVFCGTHAIARMSAAGRGSIVNVTSGAHMGLNGHSIYGASKGAISSLTYCWAVDVEGTGVRVNAVSPRAATGMAHDLIDSLGLTGDERQAKLDTFPTAAANAPVVAYLLSDRSGALHGQTVRIDGDRLSIISKPSIQGPELIEEAWTVDKVAAAFAGPLASRLMPQGFARVTGDFHFETHKSEA